MPSITDEQRASYIDHLGLSATDAARLSLSDLQNLYFDDPPEEGGGDPQETRVKSPLQAATLSASGDSFLTDVLDPAWTARSITPGFPYSSPGIRLDPAARGQIHRAAPAASEYEVVAMFDGLGGVSAAASAGVLGQWGVAILSSAGTGVSAGIHTADPARMWLHQITAWEYVGVYGAGADPGTLKVNRIALALHKSGTDYRMRSSNDGGTTWTAYTAVSAVAFTPAYIAFGRFHTGGTAGDNQITLRHFDVYTPSFA